jgi:hypothetical protein
MRNRKRPVAETRPLPTPLRTRRPLGLAKGAFKIPKEFFKPLPASVIEALRGERS